MWTYKKEIEKSTFGMRLAKCLKSRLTERKTTKKENKKRTKAILFRFSVFFVSFFQSFDLYFMFVTVLVQKAMPFVNSGQKSALTYTHHTHTHARHGFSLSLSLSPERGREQGCVCVCMYVCVCVCGLVLLTRSASLWCFSFGHSASEMEPKRKKMPSSFGKKQKRNEKNACLVLYFCCCCCVRTTHTHTKIRSSAINDDDSSWKIGAFSLRLSTPRGHQIQKQKKRCVASNRSSLFFGGDGVYKRQKKLESRLWRKENVLCFSGCFVVVVGCSGKWCIFLCVLWGNKPNLPQNNNEKRKKLWFNL